MSLSYYYRTIAEFDEMRAKLRASNLAALSRQQAINARLVAEENQGLERADSNTAPILLIVRASELMVMRTSLITTAIIAGRRYRRGGDSRNIALSVAGRN